jgi:hypothetical protein
LQNSKAHALFEQEDRGAEDCIMTARKHLFLVNNFFALLNFAKEKKKELGEEKTMSSVKPVSCGHVVLIIKQPQRHS